MRSVLHLRLLHPLGYQPIEQTVPRSKLRLTLWNRSGNEAGLGRILTIWYDDIVCVCVPPFLVLTHAFAVILREHRNPSYQVAILPIPLLEPPLRDRRLYVV